MNTVEYTFSITDDGGENDKIPKELDPGYLTIEFLKKDLKAIKNFRIYERSFSHTFTGEINTDQVDCKVLKPAEGFQDPEKIECANVKLIKGRKYKFRLKFSLECEFCDPEKGCQEGPYFEWKT